jgi:hypothetical protein
MNASARASRIPVLLRGDTDVIEPWLRTGIAARVAWCTLVVVAGAGVYGASIGWWRSPLQGAFTAVKLPLILLLTTLGNALLNGMLAPLLGLNVSFRQASLAILFSFTIAAVILGSFSPLVWFLEWNLPAMAEAGQARQSAYAFMMTTQVAAIAFAGIAANVRLRQLILRLGGSESVARRILVAWLAGNLLLGAQLTWILRPFFGSPALPVEFLRADAFRGNFFEALFANIRTLFSA